MLWGFLVGQQNQEIHMWKNVKHSHLSLYNYGGSLPCKMFLQVEESHYFPFWSQVYFITLPSKDNCMTSALFQEQYKQCLLFLF